MKTTMNGASRTETTSDAMSGNTSAISSSIDNVSVNSSLQITAHKLNGKNYLEWA